MRTHTLSLAVTLAFGGRVGPAAAQERGALSAAERQIVSAVDLHDDAALDLLIRVVNINSGTMNFAGVRQVGDIFRAEFDSLGFTTRWVDGSGFGRAGHLVAEHPGPGPKLLLIGHLDTVFQPGSPFQRFERLDDSTARGPRVIDMKGGDVIIVYALRALKDVGLLDGMNIVVVFDGDEEDAGAGAVFEASRVLDQFCSPSTTRRVAISDTAPRQRWIRPAPVRPTFPSWLARFPWSSTGSASPATTTTPKTRPPISVCSPPSRSARPSSCIA